MSSLNADSPGLSRAVWHRCVSFGWLVARGLGHLDVPGCGDDLGSTCQAVVLGQDHVEVVAEVESNCLGAPTSLGEVNLNLHCENDGLH